MTNVLLGFQSICTLLYVGLWLYAWRKLVQPNKLNLNSGVFYTLLLSILCHGYLCYLSIDGGHEQNLGLFNIFCMTTWLSMMLVAWNLLKHQAYPLLLISLPVAIISILGTVFLQGNSPILNETKWTNLLHIFSGITAISVMLLAGLQATLILYLDKKLRSRPADIPPIFSSLDSMERYLIQLLILGFILMSCSLALVISLPIELKSSQALHKIILTILSWLVIAALLLGHYIRGWRGIFMSKWSIVGIFLLLLGYFGSKLVIEFILKT